VGRKCDKFTAKDAAKVLKRHWKRLVAAALTGASIAVGAVAVADAFESSSEVGPRPLGALNGPFSVASQNAHLSSAVLLRYWAKHPDQAPSSLQPTLAQLSRTPGGSPGASVPAAEPAAASVSFNYRFNNETLGMPQNEEALTKCANGVLGGVNDYRGFFHHSETADGTGWEYSADGGASLSKEGDLPGAEILGFYSPSQGDPSMASYNPGTGCVFYAATIAFGDFEGPSAIIAYRAGKPKLDGDCTTNCWPVKKVVVRYRHQGTEFADKEWIAAGPKQGGGGQVVVVYTLFELNQTSIQVVTCDDQLTTCGSPQQLDNALSWTNDFVQFPYVSIGPTGKIYVTWVYWKWDSTLGLYTAQLKGRVYGGGSWGPTRTIRNEAQPIEPGFFILLGMPPRVATQAKGAVSPGNRWWVVWDRCGTAITVFGECGDSNIVARYSDDDGATWSSVIQLNNQGGHQWFPSQPSFGNASNMVIAYYTTEYARAADGFDSRYDTAARVSTNADTPDPTFANVRITDKPSNPLSDWFGLSSFFIGDYISAVAEPGVGYVHYNAEYTKLVPETSPCLPPGACLPANQQDNYLSKFTFP
jgi:hypothetical protein